MNDQDQDKPTPFDDWPPSQRIAAPNGAAYFGLVPALKLDGMAFPESPITLRAGRHDGPNRGFGLRHIWAEHHLEMHRFSLTEITDVPAYVAAIIRPMTPLYFDASHMRRTRLLAVRSASGTAVLEFVDRHEIWSVVTAYSGTKTHGTRVGTVR